MSDQLLFEAIELEYERQRDHIELIASENYVSQDVLDAVGSILTNKYAEGYPGNRYYSGCEFVDQVERLAIDRAKELFGAEHANVQPHSGSQANMAVYQAVLEHGDVVLGMDLNSGGHLTHGHQLSFSGINYTFFAYSVDKHSEKLDYEAIRHQALAIQPKLIIAGASAYSQAIDFAQFRSIADEVGAYLMVDMAHIAGLVAAGLHQSPVPYADFVTSTTHKTLRGPRGGLVLCKAQFAKQIDSAVFPGIQGGPLMHVIAAKAVCFKEALEPQFKVYQAQVIKNIQAMAKAFVDLGYRVVSGTTMNHLVMIDTKGSIGITGAHAAKVLDKAGITINKNAIPFDSERPAVTSGIRLGSPAMTSRGFKEQEFIQTAIWIDEALRHPDDEELLLSIKEKVRELTSSFPMRGEY